MTPSSAAVPPVASGWQPNHTLTPRSRPRHIVLIDSCVSTAGTVSLAAYSLALAHTDKRGRIDLEKRKRREGKRERERDCGEKIDKEESREGKFNAEKKQRRKVLYIG